MSIVDRIEAARVRTVDFLATLQAPDAPPGVFLISRAHDPQHWPGVLLPGTYNAVLCARLIGAPLPADPAALIAWLEGFRLADGRFRVPQMRDQDVFKKPDLAETWRYIDFHITNYTLGAIAALDPVRSPVLRFAEPYLDPRHLKAWLADRDFRDPWQEGNNIVNLGSFLLGMGARAGDALAILFDWHDRLQEPTTGFWGVGQHGDSQQLLHAMAGSMHNYHLWYATGRPLPYQDRAVAYCLSLPPAVHSACIDVDIIDVLVHGLDRRVAPVATTRQWLETWLDAILADQNPDGGFCDVRTGLRRQDGWVNGYSEPQGLSNTFATWFRWIGIAMAADVLWPSRWPWQFRTGVGIGYRWRR